MIQLSDEERQILLRLIRGRIVNLSGNLAREEFRALIDLRRKLEGTDKRVIVEGP